MQHNTLLSKLTAALTMASVALDHKQFQIATPPSHILRIQRRPKGHGFNATHSVAARAMRAAKQRRAAARANPRGVA